MGSGNPFRRSLLRLGIAAGVIVLAVVFAYLVLFGLDGQALGLALQLTLERMAFVAPLAFVAAFLLPVLPRRLPAWFRLPLMVTLAGFTCVAVAILALNFVETERDVVAIDAVVRDFINETGAPNDALIYAAWSPYRAASLGIRPEVGDPIMYSSTGNDPMWFLMADSAPDQLRSHPVIYGVRQGSHVQTYDREWLAFIGDSTWNVMGAFNVADHHVAILAEAKAQSASSLPSFDLSSLLSRLPSLYGNVAYADTGNRAVVIDGGDDWIDVPHGGPFGQTGLRPNALLRLLYQMDLRRQQEQLNDKLARELWYDGYEVDRLSSDSHNAWKNATIKNVQDSILNAAKALPDGGDVYVHIAAHGDLQGVYLFGKGTDPGEDQPRQYRPQKLTYDALAQTLSAALSADTSGKLHFTLSIDACDSAVAMESRLAKLVAAGKLDLHVATEDKNETTSAGLQNDPSYTKDIISELEGQPAQKPSLKDALSKADGERKHHLCVRSRDGKTCKRLRGDDPLVAVLSHPRIRALNCTATASRDVACSAEVDGDTPDTFYAWSSPNGAPSDRSGLGLRYYRTTATSNGLTVLTITLKVCDHEAGITCEVGHSSVVVPLLRTATPTPTPSVAYASRYEGALVTDNGRCGAGSWLLQGGYRHYVPDGTTGNAIYGRNGGVCWNETTAWIAAIPRGSDVPSNAAVVTPAPPTHGGDTTAATLTATKSCTTCSYETVRGTVTGPVGAYVSLGDSTGAAWMCGSWAQGIGTCYRRPQDPPSSTFQYDIYIKGGYRGALSVWVNGQRVQSVSIP